ncbi:TauD/TfdA family dioxygenase [Bradyrhizobium ontarionense]|uniref:TauD/TfdA family dioxygenase n=1 Tax=Bradyrhizobium ontarionense TaxID=2898149 RepID=A0ABY3R929_9BRAD|nr:TauD/TfdA family dioxygenase [Bradyrhizobium sp. A19]UFZ03311.1 TauD/TfdA family dioxygenase [Bradyrhizobium sp. A19]
MNERKQFPLSRRALPRALPTDPSGLVEYHDEVDSVPLLMLCPRFDGLVLTRWLGENGPLLRELVTRSGAVLLRGFSDPSAEALSAGLSTLGDGRGPEAYVNRSTPRLSVGGNIYTATEYPADRVIPPHNEMSYTARWPLFLGLMCVQPAETGGETPIYDSRKVLAAIPQEVREAFERHGVLYLRTLAPGIDLPWQEVFQLDDPVAVEAFCNEQNIRCDWLDRDTLRIAECHPAVRRHPRTREEVWFNQAHLFHHLALGHGTARVLSSAVGADRLPRDAQFGDGTAIPADMLEAVKAAYAASAMSFFWQPGDMLLLDNMMFAHARNSYGGKRRVLAGMTAFVDGVRLEDFDR